MMLLSWLSEWFNFAVLYFAAKFFNISDTDDNNCKEMGNQRLFLIRDWETGVMPRYEAI